MMRPTRVLFNSVMTKTKPCLGCVHLNTKNKTCWKYSQQDIVMDEPCHIQAITCRYDENKCGMKARDYQQMTSKELLKRNFHDYYSIPVIYITTVAGVFIYLKCFIHFGQ